MQRQTEIAEASKEKELKLALYKQEQDIAKAKADQAYNLEKRACTTTRGGTRNGSQSR